MLQRSIGPVRLLLVHGEPVRIDDAGEGEVQVPAVGIPGDVRLLCRVEWLLQILDASVIPVQPCG